MYLKKWNKNFWFYILFLFTSMEAAAAKKVVLITGSSRGIGKAIAQHLADQECYKIYATMRTIDSTKWPENVVIKALDVTDESSCQSVVQEIIDSEGCIDVLINNAGQGLFGNAEMVTIEQAKDLFDVNFFGALRMIQAVLPFMREQKSGKIINISSIVGFRPGPCWDLYNASKFALEGLSESLTASLRHWNIYVSLVEPGPVATEFAESTTHYGNRFSEETNPYNPLFQNAFNRVKTHLKTGQEPIKVAECVEKIIEAKVPDVRYQTSDHVHQVAREKFIDPSGNALIEKQRTLLESLWEN